MEILSLLQSPWQPWILQSCIHARLCREQCLVVDMYDRFSGRLPIPFSSPCCLNGSNPRPTLRHRLPCTRRISNGRIALHPTTCSSIDLNHARPRWLSHEQGYPTMPILVQWSTSSSIEQAYYGAGRSQSQLTLTVQQIRHTQILWHLCLIRLWRRFQLNTV